MSDGCAKGLSPVVRSGPETEAIAVKEGKKFEERVGEGCNGKNVICTWE